MTFHHLIHESDLDYTAVYFVIAGYLALMVAFIISY